MIGVRRFWRRFRRDRRGVAALEMALVTTFLLLPLTAAISGAGQALIARSRVDLGLHAGLMYAWGLPTATNSQIITAAQAASGPTNTTVTANATVACYCIPATGTRAAGTVVDCAGSCSSGVLGRWVTVSTSSSFTPIFPAFGTTQMTLTATGTVRVQ